MDTETNRITPPVELQQLVIFPTAEQHTGTVVFLHVSSYLILACFRRILPGSGLGTIHSELAAIHSIHGYTTTQYQMDSTTSVSALIAPIVPSDAHFVVMFIDRRNPLP